MILEKDVQIQTTSVCNAKCRICPYSQSTLSKVNKHMTKETFENVIQFLVDNVRIRKLALYMQSEPYADPMLYDRIIYLKKYINFSLLEISSNMSIATKNRVDRIVEACSDIPTDFIASVHSFDKEEYEKMTGLSWDTSIANLRHMLKVTDNTNIGRMLTSICDVNEAKLFIKSLVTSLELKSEIRLRSIRSTSRAGNLKTEYGYKFRSKFNKADCHRLFAWTHINWNGDIIICCNDYNNEVIIGNVTDKDIVHKITHMSSTIQPMLVSDTFICNRCDRGEI